MTFRFFCVLQAQPGQLRTGDDLEKGGGNAYNDNYAAAGGVYTRGNLEKPVGRSLAPIF
jgi:hypothetical protein